MILILSQDNDQSTNDIIDWLSHNNGLYKRINNKEIYFGNNMTFRLGKKTADTPLFGYIGKVNIVWLRRWYSGSQITNFIYDKDEAQAVFSLRKALKYESDAFSTFFLKSFPNTKWVTSIEQLFVNKLVVLQEAISIGFDIPETLVTNNVENFTSFCKEYDDIITKPASEMEVIEFDNRFFANHTISVKNDENADSDIPLSLFQEYLDKEFEIRTFYFYGTCFSMAIFSQSDAQTKTDFRVYNHNKPNRRIPFKFDDNMETQIALLMKKLKLDTGSLDFVKTKNGRIVFLEVNPVGQFGMISYPCNYYLENLIAKHLINQDS